MGQLLHSEAWLEFFRGLELAGSGTLATVTVLDESGRTVRTAAPARTLRAIQYDRERDVLELGVGGESSRGPSLRYFISAPRRIIVDDSARESRILIEDKRRGLTAIVLQAQQQMAATR